MRPVRHNERMCLFPLLVLFLFGVTASGGDDVATWQAKARAGIQKLQSEGLWNQGAVGVVYQDERSLQLYGANGKSIFELGSVSKAFTGILLAEVVAEFPGMSVDDSVGKLVPELNGTFSGKITLRQLATHTSGLPRMPSPFQPKDPSNPYVDFSQEQLLVYLKKFAPEKPGPYSVEYSNTGAALLGLALTRATHQSFDTMVVERIARPLRMTNTSVERPSSESVPGLVHGFSLDHSKAHPWEWDVFAPAGGILSTADDLMKFLAANVSPPDTPLGRAIKSSQLQGLGWDSAPGAPIVFKNGQTGGFSSIVLLAPKQRRGIFVLANIGSGSTDSVATMPFGVPMPDMMGKDLSDGELDACVGIYGNERGDQLKVTRYGKFLFTSVDDLKLRLSAVTNTEFNGFDGLHENGYEKVTFEKKADSRASSVVLHIPDETTGQIKDYRFSANVRGNTTSAEKPSSLFN